MKMKKFGIILGIFLALNCIIDISNADIYWYFGDNELTDYVIAGSPNGFVIPATMVVTEADLPVGYFSVASAYALRDGYTYVDDEFAWQFGFHSIYPTTVNTSSGTVSGLLSIGAHHWEI